jgi:hypothetical protein
MPRRIASLSLILAAGLLHGVAAGAAERYIGTMVDMANVSPGTATRFELSLDGLTSAQRLAELAALEKEKGQDGLQDALWDERLGYIRVGDELGYPVSLAIADDGGEGRVIYAVMDRPIQLYEIWQGLRTRDYHFSVAELHLDGKGEGTGSLWAVAKVRVVGSKLKVENWQPQPFRLLEIRKVE